MKKIFTSALMLLALCNAIDAQTTVNVQDSIFTNTHWTCDKQYLLKGYVYVTNGTILTIDPGVIIRGDKNTKGSLIVERGAKIMAAGTAAQPIVFTSNQAVGNRSYGDWGGLILCGYAPTNWASGVGQVEGGPRSLYGGTNPHDNSGVLQFVRVEFAGIAFSPNNEINGVTFCSVGDATTVDHIQVSYSGDDSYEWFGGNVNAKYLIAYRGWDDDFDTDNGYSGKNQFVVGLRDPFAADQSGSKAFESDSYQSGTKTGLSGDTTGLTKCVFSNATVIGPLVNPTSTAYDPQFVAGVHIRRGSAISIMNSIIAGYPAGILYDESSSSFGSTVRNLDILGSAGDSIQQIRNTIIAGIPANVAGNPARKELYFTINGARSLTPTSTEGDTITGNPFNPNAGPFSFYNVASYKNKMYPTEQNGVRLQSPFNLSTPDFRPTSTSPVVYNSTALPAYVNAHYGGADHFGNGKLYPFNTSMPINTDTSNWFANYNAPSAIPSFSSDRLQNPFFTKVNYVGAFAGTGSTSDNWMATWTNFDPVNTDYTAVCNLAGIKSYNDNNSYALTVYPNPTRDNANVTFVLQTTEFVQVNVYDMAGKMIKSVYADKANAGINNVHINTGDLEGGIYLVKINTERGSQTSKMVILK